MSLNYVSYSFKYWEFVVIFKLENLKILISYFLDGYLCLFVWSPLIHTGPNHPKVTWSKFFFEILQQLSGWSGDMTSRSCKKKVKKKMTTEGRISKGFCE